VIFFSLFHCCKKFDYFFGCECRICDTMVGGKRCHLHHVGDKSSKGTMVVVQQHVVLAKLTIDEQHVVSLDPLPTHPQMCIGGDDQA
jgi:hypothetical protein